jgi:hypothetical protein
MLPYKVASKEIWISSSSVASQFGYPPIIIVEAFTQAPSTRTSITLKLSNWKSNSAHLKIREGNP